MANEDYIFSLFFQCSEKRKFVYEVCNLFGHNQLTLDELEYWTCFSIIERARFEKVSYKALPIEEVIKLIKQAERKRREKNST